VLDRSFELLPIITQALLKFYRLACQSYNKNPGKISLYMAGGRVKGSPLKRRSDIDLVFIVSYANGSLANYSVDEQDRIGIVMQQGIDILSRTCKANGISNQFHIINYGTIRDEEYQKALICNLQFVLVKPTVQIILFHQIINFE